MKQGVYNMETTIAGDTIEQQVFTIPSVLLTGAAIQVDFKRQASYDYVKRLSVGSGITINSATVFTIGKFNANFGVGTFVLNIQITFADGDVKTYIGGELIVVEK